MLKGKMESLVKLIWKGMKFFFKYIFLILKWIVWEFMPLHLIFSKFFPNSFPDKKPATIAVWLCAIYIACFAFASERYTTRLERAEYAYSNYTLQLSSGVPFDSDRLKKVGEIKLPVKPKFTWPWKATDLKNSLLFSSNNYQTFAANEGFETTEKFVRRDIRFWKHKLNNANLFGIDLAGEDLYGVNLSGANLSGANLSGASLVKSDLSGANLVGTNLSETDLSGANLAGTDLTRTQLTKANLSKVSLSNADLFGIDLSWGKLPGADLAGANLSGINLTGANLSGADLSGTDLSTADLPKANLSSANLSLANLFGADLTKANLFGADLFEANLSSADLTRANLSSSNFTSAKLSNASLNRANLLGTVFYNTDFSGVKNITTGQLIKAKTLFLVKKLNETIEDEIRTGGYNELIDANPEEKERYEEEHETIEDDIDSDEGKKDEITSELIE